MRKKKPAVEQKKDEKKKHRHNDIEYGAANNKKHRI
jgi:hypothetical protein